MYTTRDDWAGDPHRHNRRVHYRLYMGRDDRPAVICVQDFDYVDYDARLILSPGAWDVEADAEQALAALLTALYVVEQAVPVDLDHGPRARLIAAQVREWWIR